MTCKKLVPEGLPWLFICCGNLTEFIFYLYCEQYTSISEITGKELGCRKNMQIMQKPPVFNHITPEILNFKQLLKYSAVACLYWERTWGWKVSPRECDVSNENKPIGPCLRIFGPHLIRLLGKLWPCNQRFFSGSGFRGYNSQIISQITLSSQRMYLKM